MPAYPQGGLAKLLRGNQQGFMFNNELVIVGEFSVAFQLERISHSAYPWGASFEAIFSANPGTFEIDIMGANVDQLANYNLLGSITATNNATSGAWVGRYDMASNLWPKFVLGYINKFPSFATVQVTLQATR